MAAASVEVDAALAAEARERRDLSVVADVRQRSTVTIAEAQAVVTSHGVALTTGSRRVADAYLATARAQHGRIDGADDPRAWAALADCWRELGAPYEVARARWREAGARLASGGGRSGRLEAREPLLDALGIGLELGARPLVRELRELAGRALIAVPQEVGLLLDAPGPSTGAAVVVAPTPSSPSSSSADRSVIVRGGGDDDASADASTDTFGLSRREREVLGLLAQGRTNREIGERLFISQKTVGVHVGNILAKLGVSGRVEAAAVAIRLELVERR
ncbi:MAG: response regulator transcription factor [Chloroflexi bacterium]|nr:response regulator transcription factor [Chloroflexota bacterium]